MVAEEEKNNKEEEKLSFVSFLLECLRHLPANIGLLALSSTLQEGIKPPDQSY